MVHISKNVRYLTLTFAIALIATMCLIPGLNGEFFFDDLENIVRNHALQVGALTLDNVLYAAYSYQPGHGTRALSMLSFALDFWRGGLDPQVFRTTNIAIHFLTVFALAFFLRSLFRSANWPQSRANVVSLFVTAIWALHPLQISSVLYIVQRMQILVTLFMLLALWSYSRMRQAQIEGLRSQQFLIQTALFWVLGFASKEDAALLPIYLLSLELTLFQFRAANSKLALLLRRTYGFLAVAGILVYFFLVVPHFWTSNDYPGRTFSSPERLLTQGRVLVMHIGQILVPLPSSMPFFYDDFEVSSGWLAPPSTLLSWFLIGCLLATSWALRAKRPIFSFGVLLYFGGHFLTSNVLNLELIFEHRNHLPMIGMLLAASDAFLYLIQKLKAPMWCVAALSVCVLATFGGLSAYRSYMWGDPLRFARLTLSAAPHSERAWVTYAGVFVDRSKLKPTEDLRKAVSITEQGTHSVKDPTLLLSNLLIYKTILGTAQKADWQRFIQSFQKAPINAQNRRIVWTYIDNSVGGRIVMDEQEMLKVIDISNERAPFSANQNLQAAAYIFSETLEPKRALPYLVRAVELSPPNDPSVLATIRQLESLGYKEWASKLEAVRLESAKQENKSLIR